ncbi:MAG: hypothetical protein LUG52_06985 [Clostridia bacterium]|nr:hypothetical protein [Clostridia bacterium]
MEYGILFLLVLVVILYLETLLSSLKNKYIGLILPALSFLSSFAWFFMGNLPSGNIIASVLLTLILANIPTFLLLLIYHHARKPAKASKKAPKEHKPILPFINGGNDKK